MSKDTSDDEIERQIAASEQKLKNKLASPRQRSNSLKEFEQIESAKIDEIVQ
eukprot:COSAG01_NODE_52234_length_348_cov_0.678715_1_plen_51_part_01